jgi:hypothetical protein
MKGRGDQTPGDSVDGEFESSNGAPEKYRAKQMAELVVQMRERKEKEVSRGGEDVNGQSRYQSWRFYGHWRESCQ